MFRHGQEEVAHFRIVVAILHRELGVHMDRVVACARCHKRRAGELVVKALRVACEDVAVPLRHRQRFEHRGQTGVAK